jgi:hypothetical protein
MIFQIPLANQLALAFVAVILFLRGFSLLPSKLYGLECPDCQLTTLPVLPPTIFYLYCNNNQLTSIPTIPQVMSRFLVHNNNISCFDYLPSVYYNSTLYVNISNNPITCVPNQTVYSLGLPLCIDADSVNNPNNCLSLANITGKIFTDQKHETTFVYPNPSTGLFTIKSASAIKTIEVFNLIGESVLQQTNGNTINISSQPQGIYFCKVNGSSVVKLVKE